MTTQSNAGTASGTLGSIPDPASYQSRVVEAAGLRLHYLDYGTGARPPMLCVHGGAAHAHWFDFVAPGFVANYHVRSLDLRGHGDSEWADPPDYGYGRFAQDLSQVVERLDLRDFVLVGHSMGGMISLLYAATYPGRVARLVVVDSTLQMTEERVANLRGVGNREGRRYASSDEFVASYKLRPAGTMAAPEVIGHLARMSGRRSDDGMWRHKFDRNIYARRESVNGYPCWDRIRIPALLVKGDRSARISPQVFAEVKSHCPQVELAEVSDSDHHVTLDNPTGFVHAVNAFLAKHA